MARKPTLAFGLFLAASALRTEPRRQIHSDVQLQSKNIPELAANHAKEAREEAERQLLDFEHKRQLAAAEAKVREQRVYQKVEVEARQRARQKALQMERQAMLERQQIQRAEQEHERQLREDEQFKRDINRMARKEDAMQVFKEVWAPQHEERFIFEDIRKEAREQLNDSLMHRLPRTRRGRVKRDSRLDPLEATMGNNISVEDLIDMIEALGRALKEQGLHKRVKQIIIEVEALSSRFVQQYREKAQEFRIAAHSAHEQGFVELLAKYLNTIFWLEKAHSSQGSVAKGRILDLMPSTVQQKMEPILDTMSADNFTLQSFNIDTFKDTRLPDICDKVASIGKAILDYQRNLTRAHSLLNSTSQMMPVLMEFLPDTPKNVIGFLQDILNLGYTEVLVHEKAIMDLSTISVPIIMEKTDCEWNAAGPQLNFGLVSVMVFTFGLVHGLQLHGSWQ